MKYKRITSVLIASSLILAANISTSKGYDGTVTQAINMDLMVLAVSSLKQVNQQVQQPAHNCDCDK